MTSQHGWPFQKSGIFVLALLYPRFCPILFGVNSSGTHGSVRQGQGASHVSKWQTCITRMEVNFPHKVSVHQIFVPRSGMFFHFVVKFNVLVDFCESCKKSGVISKVYAFDSACFYCCAQPLKKSSSRC